ncbi:protein HAPLESS 2 isoform X5 [Diospyros lotus]|uniref:protein HAPLESS 2 isoform X5 n=1 Tax=Diospyros lotus TaxID=55363 RepID=UPI0022568F21|nr:protein HAPLESS 2 isoform X5 [Diospyros lotus]
MPAKTALYIPKLVPLASHFHSTGNQTKHSNRMRPLSLLLIIFSQFLSDHIAFGAQILSKSKLQKCEKFSDSSSLNCTAKIVVNMAIPSESSGREASIVAEIVEVEENSSMDMRALRIPPVITINKSAAYALYELTYIRDVAYKPEELYVQTRKCEPDAGADVVKNCERLRDENGHIIEHTEPTCCPCGDQRRVPSSCGNFFDKMMKGKANTAHCLRFPGDWFHVFGIGQRSLGFSIRIEVKTASRISEVIVGPENRTVTSGDNFLRANLIGDYVGYTNIPSFEEYYLVIPRQGGPGQPQNLGRNFSMWMLLERVRFTLDGLECNKIGLGYEAFNGQPDFCSSPFWSCLHNQLWNFWDADMNRISRNQSPLYVVQRRFERINQHPNSGSHSFSIGITEVLNTNLLIELSADDIESPGKILGITVPTFEALTQFGTATITTQNIGEVEASYSLTFDCSTGVSLMEEQFFIMKPKEVTTRSFKLYPTTDQAGKYVCAAILKDSGFSEVDRAECQFSTTATVVDNGSQIPFQPPKTSINSFFESIEILWNKFWNGLADFVTGKTCRSKCSGFFDFSCHIQYICMSWMVMFGLLLAIFPTVVVLLWLLHEKGLFDPLYDWWDHHFRADEQRLCNMQKHGFDADVSKFHIRKHKRQGGRYHMHNIPKKRRSVHREHGHKHSEYDTNYHYHLHHVHKDKHKHGRAMGTNVMQKLYLDKEQDDHTVPRRCRKGNKTIGGLPNITRYIRDENKEDYYKHKNEILREKHFHVKHRE